MLALSSANNTPIIDPNSFGNLALKGLEEISLPEKIAYVPVSLGWQILLLLAVAYSFYRAYLRLRTWQHNRYRREALAAIRQIKQQALSPNLAIPQLATLLKATALKAYPRAQIASLYGEEWLIFLNKQTEKPLFDKTSEQLLTAGQYEAPTTITEQSYLAFAQQVEQWLIEHYGDTIGKANA